MLLKADSLIIKRASIQTADEASILQDELFLLFLTTEVREGVNDDTKDEVENDNNDYEEEEKIVHNSGHK